MYYDLFQKVGCPYKSSTVLSEGANNTANIFYVFTTIIKSIARSHLLRSKLNFCSDKASYHKIGSKNPVLSIICWTPLDLGADTMLSPSMVTIQLCAIEAAQYLLSELLRLLPYQFTA